jgi:ATP-binding cassette, subfamily B, multidrug efflux pump
MKYFLYYIKLYRRHFWTGIGFLAITDILDVIPPLIIGRGVNQITEGAPVRELMKTALFFGGLTLSLAFVRFHWRMQFGKYHQNMARDLRNRVFKKLTELGPTFYSKNPVGDLMSLMTNDIETIRMGFGPGVMVLTDAVFYFLTIPPIMLWLSVPLTLKTLIMIPVLPFFITWISNIVQKRYLLVQDSFGELSSITQENISGIRVIKSYVQEKNQIDIFNKSSANWRDLNIKVAWVETWMHPVMELSITVGMVVLLFSGSKDIISGAITLGTFVAFQRYISKMVWPMTAVGWGFSLVAQGRASLDRIDTFLNTPLDVTPPPKPVNELNLNGPIEVRSLDFKYPGSEKFALRNISFVINPGETIGIVGHVGSGKTTLAQLLCHLYEVDRGHIFVNRNDTRDIPLDILRKHISFVPQDTFLFSTGINENMSFGLNEIPSLETLRHIAQIAKLDEEIESLPQRYETPLGERGVNLSGGQKQRMTITRALLRNSPVVIFDDSLSAVDAETESLILKRLREETKEQTTLIISHRLSSLSLCDRIIVLRNGLIENIGTPGELRKNSSIYQELLQLQGYL